MEDNNKRKVLKDIGNQTGAQIGNEFSRNLQDGSNISIDGMDLFREKASKLVNVGYEQGKGNLFEYIEGAKLNKNMANSGVQGFDKNPITDLSSKSGGIGEPHAADDFRFVKKGKIIGKGQAKVNNNAHDSAVNFTNPKYKGMQIVAPSDKYEEINQRLKDMYQKGEISKQAYEDASANLRRELTDESTGITSGGTTTDELKQFMGKDGKVSKEATLKYAKRFEIKQFAKEVGTTTAFGAVSGAAVSGIVSGTQNLFQVFQNKKELDEALKDIGVDVVKGGARGGAIGFLSSVIRIGGKKAAIPVVSDGSAATVIAGSVIDSGVAIYAYGKGEISVEELRIELQNTVIKSTATIYFTKAIGATLGGVGTFTTMAVYSVASYVVTCTREIIRNAHLNAQEYKRLKELNDQAVELVIEYREEMERQMSKYISTQKSITDQLLNDFDYNIQTGENYDKAIYSILNFANQTGLILQYVGFNDFNKAMLSDKAFILK